MKKTRYWLVFLLLGLLCNALGIFLHRQGAEAAAITLVVLGIINVATSFILHWRTMKKEG
jgi:O-antigen/teichoic acid export membrane protein